MVGESFLPALFFLDFVNGGLLLQLSVNIFVETKPVSALFQFHV